MPPKAKVIPNFPEPSSELELFQGAPPGKIDKPPLAGKKTVPEGKPGCLNGINFVISGIFPSLTRDECKALIEKYGGKVMSSLSGNTDVLVCGFTNVGPSKIKKAKDLNIQMTDEDGLFSVIQSSNPDFKPSEPPKDNADDTTELSLTNQENLSDLIALQELLYSDVINVQSLQEMLEDLKKKYPIQEIDHQLILAFSLDYSRIPILLPLLSKRSMEKTDFIHGDQELLYQLIEAGISFPLDTIWEKCLATSKLGDEDCEYPYADCSRSGKYGTPTLLYYQFPPIILEEKLMAKFKQCPAYAKDVEQTIFDDFLSGRSIWYEKIRQKEEIEEIIENDDLERFRDLAANDFNFNNRIQKENALFEYFSIPILSYCIEKKALKCFKYAFINGADPLQKSQAPDVSFSGKWGVYLCSDKNDDIWDAYGFAGAIGNIQFIKILQESTKITSDLIMGCTKFHKNNVLSWALKENPSFAKYGLNNALQFENIQGINQLLLDENSNFEIDVGIEDRCKRTPLHHAARAKFYHFADILIKKGAKIDAEDINNTTPLHEAAKSDCVEIAQLLLDHGADKDDKCNKSYKSTLHQTAQFNSKKVCKLLIKSGVEIYESEGGAGCSFPLLCYAAQFNSKDVAEILLNAGASFSKYEEDNFNPLHIAARYNSKETCEVLLKAKPGDEVFGTNSDDDDDDDLTPLQSAEKFLESCLCSKKVLEKSDLDTDEKNEENEEEDDDDCILHYSTSDIFDPKKIGPFWDNLTKRAEEIVNMIKSYRKK